VSEKHADEDEHAKAEQPDTSSEKHDKPAATPDKHEKPKTPQKAIGVTMALLGVMLAFCAAMVGASRTELIRNTVEQSNQYSEYQAETMKFRVLEADYDLLHAVTPNRAELAKFGKKLGDVKSLSGKADDEDTAEIKEAVDLSTRELVELLTPDKEDEERLLKKKREYAHDMKEAKEDAEAYDLILTAYSDAASGFEKAQLCTEVGLVIASMALLLGNRLLWIVSLVIGLAGGGVAAKTQKEKGDRIAAAEGKIKAATAHSAALANEEAEEPGVAPAPKASGSAGAAPKKE
jgi:hypothetical protein